MKKTECDSAILRVQDKSRETGNTFGIAWDQEVRDYLEETRVTNH